MSQKRSQHVLKVVLVMGMLLSHLLVPFKSLSVNATGDTEIALVSDEVATWQDETFALFPESDIDYLCMHPDERGWRWEIPRVPFPIGQSSITLPYRRLTASERAVWVAEYAEMGGPTDFEQEVIRLVNEVRMSHGRSPVALDRSLAMASRFHAQTMATFGVANNWSHHVGPYAVNGTGASSNVAQVFGRVAGSWAGNAFTGAGNHEPGSVVEGLLNSPGHCRSLLNPIHQYIGAGVHVGSRWGRESGMSHYLMLSSAPLLSRHTTTVEDGMIATALGETEVGEFLAGEEVEITANVMPPGTQFVHWEGPVTFANATQTTTTFTMPSQAVTVRAAVIQDEDEDPTEEPTEEPSESPTEEEPMEEEPTEGEPIEEPTEMPTEEPDPIEDLPIEEPTEPPLPTDPTIPEIPTIPPTEPEPQVPGDTRPPADETPIVISGSEETVMQHAEGEDAYVDVKLRVDSWSEAYDLFALQFWVVFDAEALTPVELTPSALLPLDELPELSDEMSFVFFDLEMFGATDPGELATIRFRINDTRIPGEIPVTLIPVSGHVTSWNAASTERPVEVGTQGLITIEPIEDVPTDPNPATLRDILRELIQEATARTQTNYTPMSWARMQSMLTSARAVYNNQTSTDAQIEQAIHLLTGALVSLIER